MKILIYGGNGLIGNQFVNILNKNKIVYDIDLSRCDDLDNLKYI